MVAPKTHNENYTGKIHAIMKNKHCYESNYTV